MRPTRFGLNGLLFHLVLLAGYYASPYSNLFFLLLAFLTLLGASGVLAARRNLHGVTAELSRLPSVPAGREVEAAALLAAPGRVRFALELRLLLAGGGSLSGHAGVLAGSAPVRLRGGPLRRGVHPVLAAHLESTHPFGLVRARRAVAAPAALVVHPAPGELPPRGGAAALLGELFPSQHAGAGDLQPSGLRDHREGDGLRGVHWRASARRGRLVVCEWEGGASTGVEVVLDRRAAEPELEQALETLSALVHLARREKETLHLKSQGLVASFGEGHRPWEEALHFLAAADLLPADGPAPPPAGPTAPRLPRAAGTASRREPLQPAPALAEVRP